MDDLTTFQEFFLQKHSDSYALILKKIVEQIINADPEGFDFRSLQLVKYNPTGNQQVFYKGQLLGEIEYFQTPFQIGFRFNSISTQS